MLLLFGLFQVYVCLVDLVIGLADVLLNQIEISALLMDHLFDLLHDLEVLLHSVRNLIEFGRRDVKLAGFDFVHDHGFYD